jgi:hypothetical protein
LNTNTTTPAVLSGGAPDRAALTVPARVYQQAGIDPARVRALGGPLFAALADVMDDASGQP